MLLLLPTGQVGAVGVFNMTERGDKTDGAGGEVTTRTQHHHQQQRQQHHYQEQQQHYHQRHPWQQPQHGRGSGGWAGKSQQWGARGRGPGGRGGRERYGGGT